MAMTAQPLGPRVSRLEGAFEQLDQRLGDLRSNIDARFAQVDARFAQVDARFAQMDMRFVQVENRLDGLDRKIDGLRSDVDQKFLWMMGIMFGSWVTIILAIFFHR